MSTCHGMCPQRWLAGRGGAFVVMDSEWQSASGAGGITKGLHFAWAEAGFACRSPSREGLGTLRGFP